MATMSGHANSTTHDGITASSRMEYVDSHCHFDFSDFDVDREAVWQECLGHGVTTMVIPGVEPKQWPSAAQLTEQHAGIFYAVGIHPWWVEKWIAESSVESTYRCLRENLIASKCVAVGECGLDAMIETPLVEQLNILRVHLQLASELSLPLIIHCRKAHNELLIELKKFNLPAGGVIHAFSGSVELALSYWSLGFCVGVGGTITYERAHKTRDAVKKLPIEAIVLETDAPDMPLQGRQGQRNNPANIPLIAQALADIRGESIEYIAQKTTQNARRLFNVVSK